MHLERLAILVGAVTLTAASTVQAINFNLIPDAGTPQFAIDGFSAAGDLWSSILADDVTVNIQIGFTSLGPNVIGSTGSAFIERSYTDVTQALALHRTSADDFSSYAALQSGSSYNRLINHTSDNPAGPNSGTPYVDTMDRVGLTTANAKTLGLLAPSSSLDAVIRFSSDFSFDFNHNNVAPGKIDFIGAAAHEIGHALGFISGVDDIDTFFGSDPGGGFSSNLIDLFRYSTLSLEKGNGFPDYTADQRDKYFSVDGGLTPVGSFANGINYGDGQQASHWKDNLGIGIMDPTAGYGETLNISPTDVRAFDVLGYTAAPEPGVGELTVVGLLALILFRKKRRQRSSVLLPDRQSAK